MSYTYPFILSQLIHLIEWFPFVRWGWEFHIGLSVLWFCFSFEFTSYHLRKDREVDVPVRFLLAQDTSDLL